MPARQRAQSRLPDIPFRRGARAAWRAEALILSGACDGLKPSLTRRQRLWQLHDLWPLLAPNRAPGRSSTRALRRAAQQQAQMEAAEDGISVQQAKPVEQLTLQWERPTPAITDAEVLNLPKLPALTRGERLALEYGLMGMAGGTHPLHLQRRELRRRGIQTIAALADLPERALVRVAGWVVSAQRPLTAKGMGFLVIEDETGHLPVALSPRLTVDLHRTIQRAKVLVVVGWVERIRWYRAIHALSLEALAV